MSEQPDHLKPHAFTSTNQPANRGRKKSILGVLSELTGDNFKRELSREQKMEIIEVMTEKSQEELHEIFNNKLNPIFIRLVANAIRTSMENGDVKILETIWDRVYGKAVQPLAHQDGGKAVTWGLNVFGKIPTEVTDSLPVENKEDNVE